MLLAAAAFFGVNDGSDAVQCSSAFGCCRDFEIVCMNVDTDVREIDCILSVKCPLHRA